MPDTIIIALVIGIVLLAVVLYFKFSKPALPELDDLDEPKEQPKPGRRDRPQKLPSTSPLEATIAAETKPDAPESIRREGRGDKASKPSVGKKKPAAEVAAPDGPGRQAAHADEPEDEAEETQETDADDDDATDLIDDVEPKRAPPPPPPARRARDVLGLRKGLAKVRESGGLFGRLKALFSGKKEIDPSVVEDMESILLTSDVGVKTTEALLAGIRESLERDELTDTDRVWSSLRERAQALLKVGGGAIRNHGKPTVVMMVGVNGAGKTTTIGKLARHFVQHDKKVLLVAGDTFRAAAVEQLKVWGERIGCEVFAGEDRADPASVVFDAIKSGIESGVDYIFVDTAGRLHTKSNLMDELTKISKTASKALDAAPHETLLVVDATTGQNALQQTEMFREALPLDGIVLTKLDGTARGGVVLAIAAEHKVPVRYIGIGEKASDLRDFDAEEFVEAMLGRGDDAAQAA